MSARSSVTDSYRAAASAVTVRLHSAQANGAYRQQQDRNAYAMIAEKRHRRNGDKRARAMEIEKLKQNREPNRSDEQQAMASSSSD
jgi:hypothetical protein